MTKKYNGLVNLLLIMLINSQQTHILKTAKEKAPYVNDSSRTGSTRGTLEFLSPRILGLTIWTGPFDAIKWDLAIPPVGIGHSLSSYKHLGVLVLFVRPQCRITKHSLSTGPSKRVILSLYHLRIAFLLVFCTIYWLGRRIRLRGCSF